MISSGSTVLRFDFDIFSIGPISIGASPFSANARRPAASRLDAHLGRRHPMPVGVAIGLVHDHALREQAGERLVEIRDGRICSSRGRRSANRADAGSHARRRRYTGRPAARRWRSPASSARSSFQGSVKRAKYQDESTNVSIVSVSRRAGAPQLRTGDVFPGRMPVERIAGRVEGRRRRAVRTGRSAAGTGTTPQASQWMIGIGQPQ